MPLPPGSIRPPPKGRYDRRRTSFPFAPRAPPCRTRGQGGGPGRKKRRGGRPGRAAMNAPFPLELPGPVQKGRPEKQPKVVLLLPDVELPSTRHVLPGQLPLLDGASPAEVDPLLAGGFVDQFRAIPRRVDVPAEGPRIVVHDHSR